MSKEVIDKKIEELAKEAAATVKEKKQDIKCYFLDEDNGTVGITQYAHSLALVEASEYKKLAAELKVAKYDLQKLADLVDKKNVELDQMCDEKQTVPASLFDETKARLEMCRKKLKKLGSWAGE